LPASDREIARRVEQAGRLHTSRPGAAVDSLTMLQAELLQRRPELAALLAKALAGLKGGALPATALGPVRRQLASPPVRLEATSAWTGSGVP
jgi:hypothetical protein